MQRSTGDARRIRRATALAVVAIGVRALWGFLPVYPGSSAPGFQPAIDLSSPALIWGGAAVSLVGFLVVGFAAVVLLRRAPPARWIAGGMLIAVGASVLFNSVGLLMFSIEYVRQVGDFFDVQPAGMWVGLAMSLVSAAAFAVAGGMVVPATRRSDPAPPPPVPAGALPAPPPAVIAGDPEHGRGGAG